jgi:hypothetical protein
VAHAHWFCRFKRRCIVVGIGLLFFCHITRATSLLRLVP